MKTLKCSRSGPVASDPGTFPCHNAWSAVRPSHRAALTDAKIGTLGDGRCTFTITSHTGYLERASMKMIYDAAEELTHTCISGGGGRSEGGIATGIGMFGRHLLRGHGLICAQGVLGRLNVELRDYKPMIRCYKRPGRVASPGGCSDLCDSMRLSHEYIHVRHAQQSASDIVVPWSVLPGRSMKQQRRFLARSKGLLTMTRSRGTEMCVSS